MTVHRLLWSEVEKLWDEIPDCIDSETGLVPAKKDGKWCHINYLDGTPAYEERFDWAGHFKEGVAHVSNGKEKYHIRPDGTPAYAERYDYVEPFDAGLAKVGRDGQRLYIRHDGSRVDTRVD